MSTYDTWTVGTGPTGYTCAICKSWVPNGCAHYCPSNSGIPMVDPRVTVEPKVDVFERIAAALERLVEVLENA